MRTVLFAAVAAVAAAAILDLRAQEPPAAAWIDADTGHRIVRLSDDAGGSTLYFHDNPFSPDGRTMIFNTPNGIAAVDVGAIGTERARARIVAPACAAATSRVGAARSTTAAPARRSPRSTSTAVERAC